MPDLLLSKITTPGEVLNLSNPEYMGTREFKGQDGTFTKHHWRFQHDGKFVIHYANERQHRMLEFCKSSQNIEAKRLDFKYPAFDFKGF